MPLSVFRVFVLSWLCCVFAACGRTSPESPKLVPPAAPPPVSLPDLSRMEPAVQRQMQAQYASVIAKKADAQAPRADLAAAYGDLGNLLLAAEYPDAAEPCYLNAEALAPDAPAWPYYLGHVYRTRGDLGRASAAFERVLALTPSDLAALVWLGNVRLDQGQPEAAESLFARALTLDSRSVAALFGQGRAALARRDYPRAVSSLGQALAIDPRASIVHYPLAMAYRALGDREKAEGHLAQRGNVDVGPNDPLMSRLGELLHSAVAYENRGVRALEQGQWEAAAASFRQGLELAPDKATLRHGLGTSLAMMGDPRGAFDEFQRAVRLSPTFAKAHYSLGLLLASSPQGQQQALGEFGAAVRYDPSHVEARVQLANALRRTGRLEDALREYDRVLTLDARVAEARFGYAMALERLGRYGQARDRLIEAASAHPGQLVFAHALVRLLAAAPDDRVRDGRRALALSDELLKGPRGAELADARAMALAETGQFDEAIRWQREAIAAAGQAGRSDLVPPMTETLQLYQRHKPCRTPWRD